MKDFIIEYDVGFLEDFKYLILSAESADYAYNDAKKYLEKYSKDKDNSIKTIWQFTNKDKHYIDDKETIDIRGNNNR